MDSTTQAHGPQLLVFHPRQLHDAQAARCQLRRRAPCLMVFVTRLIVTFALAPLSC